MNKIILMIFVVAFAISGMVMNLKLTSFSNSGKYLKEDLEIAVHNAALAIDQIELSNGVLVFDQKKARELFDSSFQKNTGFKKSDYKVIEFKAFDESNSKLPLKYEASTVNFKDTFNNPTVVAVVEVKAEAYLGANQDATVRKAASYTYKQKNPEAVQAAMSMLAFNSSSELSCSYGELNTNKFKEMFNDAGVLTGKENIIIDAATNHNIDPVLLASIMWHETGAGKSNAAKNYNNVGGLMNPRTDTLFRYGSLNDGINAMASVLQRLYISKGLVTIEDIGAKYAPIGVNNDPTNLNKNWVPTISNLVDKFGGLTTNCEPGQTGIDFSIEENEFLWPVPFTKNVTSQFSPNRIHPITGVVRAHNGIDIASNGVENKPVIAVKEGTVTFAGEMRGYGKIVIIKHNDGLETRYAHLNSIKVQIGSKVAPTQEIGLVGNTGDSTGAHLHFEVRKNDSPIDPASLYKK